MARVKYDFAKFEINSGIHTRKLDFGICHTPIGYPFPIIGLFVCCGNDSHCSGETQASKQGVISIHPAHLSHPFPSSSSQNALNWGQGVLVFPSMATKQPHTQRVCRLYERLEF